MRACVRAWGGVRALPSTDPLASPCRAKPGSLRPQALPAHPRMLLMGSIFSVEAHVGAVAVTPQSHIPRQSPTSGLGSRGFTPPFFLVSLLCVCERDHPLILFAIPLTPLRAPARTRHPCTNVIVGRCARWAAACECVPAWSCVQVGGWLVRKGWCLQAWPGFFRRLLGATL